MLIFGIQLMKGYSWVLNPNLLYTGLKNVQKCLKWAKIQYGRRLHIKISQSIFYGTKQGINLNMA